MQKVLAAAGIASRRASEELIEKGRVSVNGKIITEPGVKVDLSIDRVVCNGRIIKPPKKHYYIALNKPKGVVSTVSDPYAERTVVDLVDIQSRPFLRPVGRLDADSEGLIFLTDDGDFLNKLTHPSHSVGKTYRAVVLGVPDQNDITKLLTGIRLEDGKTRPASNISVKRLGGKYDENPQALVELTIFEGKNRQIRRMFAALGHPVSKLTRISIGAIRIKDLPVGAWRHLTKNEVDALIAAAEKGIDPKNKESLNKENKVWPTEQPQSKPQKGQSLSSSKKPLPQSQHKISSNSQNVVSTTGLRSTDTSRVL